MFSKPKMPHNKPALKLSQRIAEEAQLLAEEKWIIETLKKIKAQRNGLQIERLHLESMRSKILSGKDQASEASVIETVHTDSEMIDASTKLPPLNTITIDDINLNYRELDDDELCNTEELNLSVTNSVFNADPFNTPCDEEEDEEDLENCLLDMDLLMSGK